MNPIPLTDSIEWLEPDGWGGFASGTANGVRTRRYHALLLTATTPPTGRCVLVNGLEAWVETGGGRQFLSAQRYVPDVIYPDGMARLASFVDDPWPTWRWRLESGLEITLELFVPHGISACVLCWKRTGPTTSARLFVRPLLSGRDYHALQRENAAFRFEPELNARTVVWRPYDKIPSTTAVSNGTYRQDPEWYRNFIYVRETERGLDDVEDLASPGVFSWSFRTPAILVLAAEGAAEQIKRIGDTAEAIAAELRDEETRRRASFASRLDRSADAYIVGRGARPKAGTAKTVIAGYPWFTDWGRDTFLALPGLCLATGRFQEAGDILLAWAQALSEGMLPNRFPDTGDTPEFNAVDASLWYIVSVHRYLETASRAARPASSSVAAILRDSVHEILTGYCRGTRYHIHCDADGLLAAGTADTPLTWMDAKVDGRAITGRVGKAVEVQALWLSGLSIGAAFDSNWKSLFTRALAAFQTRFWNEARGCLFDVVDVDHQKGTVDASLRPNQILAVGGLPWTFLDSERARRVVDVVESRLWTPMGLRTLEPGTPGYCGRYVGSARERDAAYHQGTVWPWLMGPFVEAWVRVRGGSPAVCDDARSRFIEPLLAQLEVAGLGHLVEIADGDPPHHPRGCPFQAWSLAELIRTINPC